jgi:hypothetical protein
MVSLRSQDVASMASEAVRRLGKKTVAAQSAFVAQRLRETNSSILIRLGILPKKKIDQLFLKYERDNVNDVERDEYQRAKNQYGDEMARARKLLKMAAGVATGTTIFLSADDFDLLKPDLDQEDEG